jgi:hypothetical protein
VGQQGHTFLDAGGKDERTSSKNAAMRFHRLTPNSLLRVKFSSPTSLPSHGKIQIRKTGRQGLNLFLISYFPY